MTFSYLLFSTLWKNVTSFALLYGGRKINVLFYSILNATDESKDKM